MSRSVGWYDLPYGRRRIIFGSWLARLVGWRHPNFGLTLNRHTIRFKASWATAYHLAHEDAHCLQAERRGWWYLPWVLWGYCRSWSHDHAAAEQGADYHMRREWLKYPDIGDIPPDHLRFGRTHVQVL